MGDRLPLRDDLDDWGRGIGPNPQQPPADGIRAVNCIEGSCLVDHLVRPILVL
jgi:hypothetical protein